jgi:hypothetical protein
MLIAMLAGSGEIGEAIRAAVHLCLFVLDCRPPGPVRRKLALAIAAPLLLHPNQRRENALPTLPVQ